MFGVKDDLSVIRSSIVNIISTRKGRQPYDPNFGSFLPDLVFDPNTVVSQGLACYHAASALTEQEPRIIVRDATVRPDSVDPHKVTVTVKFSLPSDPDTRYAQDVLFVE